MAMTEEEIEQKLKEIEEKFVDDEGKISIVNLNAALQRQIMDDVSDVKGPFLGGGIEAGFRDPNERIRVEDLVGRIYSPGLLTEMRQSSDIIAPEMDKIQALIASLDYDVVPRDEEFATDAQKFAARGVDFILRNMPYLSLESFVSQAWDEVATYGFSVWEMHMPEAGPHAGTFMLHPIAPWQVYEWELNKDRTALEAVRVDNGDGIVKIPAHKIVWFGNSKFQSNYWGQPYIRSCVAAYSAFKEDVKNYLALRRLQKGVVIAQETGAGSNTASWNAVKAWLRRYYMGQTLPLLLNEGMKLEFLSIQQPGIDNYNNIMSYWDSKIRGALNASLMSLGIDGVGSLALGQEVSAEAQKAVANQINRFLCLINGETNVNSNLLHVITELLGYNPHTDTPKVVVIDNTVEDESENTLALAGLMKDGIITREDIGEEGIVKMIESLGFDSGHLKRKIEIEEE